MTGCVPVPRRKGLAILTALLVLAAGGLVPAAPAMAQTRLSADGLTATLSAPGRITVGWRPATGQRHYWCAAAALATAQGVPQTARMARLDTPARFTDAQFSTDPADLQMGGSDRFGRPATGLFSFPRGNSLTVGFAASLCDLDQALVRNED
ncbi:MAG: hypothetical protein MUF73_11395 [Rhodobacteraceae bacterium]|jgi:hypothetical protein|nr:hypothetical protein [Paracoccaceae bacterium]